MRGKRKKKRPGREKRSRQKRPPDAGEGKERRKRPDRVAEKKLKKKTGGLLRDEAEGKVKGETQTKVK